MSAAEIARPALRSVPVGESTGKGTLTGRIGADGVTSVTMSIYNIRKYEEWMLGRGHSSGTVRQRLGFAKRRLDEWGTLAPEPHEVASWLNVYEGWTKRTYYNSLQSIFEWLADEGLAEVSPLEQMRAPRQPRVKASPLTDQQLQLALGTAHGDLRAWLLLGYLSGMRCHEIAKIRGEDINESDLSIVGKGGSSETVPTHPVLWELAHQYPRRGYWFPSSYQRRAYVSSSHIGNIVRAHFRALGIETGSVHRLRHSYCTALSRNGVRPRVIQELMRHRSLDTTQGYIDCDDHERVDGVRTLTVGARVPHPGLAAPPLGDVA